MFDPAVGTRIRIIAGTDAGQTYTVGREILPHVARARIAGRTAVALNSEPETTALEPRQERAVAAAQNAPPRRPDQAAKSRKR